MSDQYRLNFRFQDDPCDIGFEQRPVISGTDAFYVLENPAPKETRNELRHFLAHPNVLQDFAVSLYRHPCKAPRDMVAALNCMLATGAITIDVKPASAADGAEAKPTIVERDEKVLIWLKEHVGLLEAKGETPTIGFSKPSQMISAIMRGTPDPLPSNAGTILARWQQGRAGAVKEALETFVNDQGALQAFVTETYGQKKPPEIGIQKPNNKLIALDCLRAIGAVTIAYTEERKENNEPIALDVRCSPSRCEWLKGEMAQLENGRGQAQRIAAKRAEQGTATSFGERMKADYPGYLLR